METISFPLDKELSRVAPEAAPERAVDSRRAPQRADDPERAQEKRAEEAPTASPRSVTFKLNREAGRFVIVVVDRETKQIVRQIPPEALIRLAEVLREQTGNLLNTSA